MVRKVAIPLRGVSVVGVFSKSHPMLVSRRIYFFRWEVPAEKETRPQVLFRLQDVEDAKRWANSQRRRQGAGTRKLIPEDYAECPARQKMDGLFVLKNDRRAAAAAAASEGGSV
jgi:hypothetical protein